MAKTLSSVPSTVAAPVLSVEPVPAPSTAMHWLNLDFAFIGDDGNETTLRDAFIALRESTRNADNNLFPVGHSRDELNIKLSDLPFASAFEMLERYYGHQLNNQGESAMLAIKKAWKGPGAFYRVSELFKWRQAIRQKILDGELGKRRTGTAYPRMSELEFEYTCIVWARMYSFAQGKGMTKFPEKWTAKSLDEIKLGDLTAREYIAKYMAGPNGAKVLEQAQAIVDQRNAAKESDESNADNWDDFMAA